MNGTIAVGSVIISVEAAWKASVVGLLATIAGALTYIAVWIST